MVPDPISEMQHAAPGARRRVLIHLGIAGLAGVVMLMLLQAAQPAVVNWVLSDPESTRTRAQLVIVVLAALVLAPVVGMAIYMWRLGAAILREDRFPPERSKLIRDVRVVRGDAARARGRVLRTSAGVLLGLAVLVAVVLWRLATLSPQR